ncbi:MAG TPA: glycosyltransferase family 39 protein [Myxococcales bacterium]|jgi:4-amino-4-deoxy-L-arabinose transferase-like glycosyltransferase|nr:glycosyltransferase family 39 protein [Myxococcales bacterium]
MDLASLQRIAENHKTVLDAFSLLAAASACAGAIALRRRPDKAALCLVMLAAVLALAMGMDDFLHRWDERYHAVVAKHLAIHPLVPTLYEVEVLPLPSDWGRAHVWVHKPPLALWLMALSLRIFGASELALRLPSIALFCAAVFATYRLGALLFTPGAGLCAAFLAAVNGALLDVATGRQPTDHPESIFASLVCLAMLAAALHARSGMRRHALAAGALTGLAILTKSLPALVVFPCWIALTDFADRPRRRATDLALAALLCVAIALPWQLYVNQAFPREAAIEARHALLHLTTALDGHAGTPFFHLARIPRFFGEASPLVLLYFLWTLRQRGREGRAVALWFGLPYLFFSFVPTKLANYILFAAPALFLMIGVALSELLAVLARPAAEASGPEAIPAAQRLPRPVLALVALALFALPVRFLVERWKPFHRFDEERALAASLRVLPARLGQEKLVLFGSPAPIETMFYTDYAAYPDPPGPEAAARAAAAGLRIVVLP